MSEQGEARPSIQEAVQGYLDGLKIRHGISPEIAEKMLGDKLNEVLTPLSDIERRVIEVRLQSNDGFGMSLTEAARQLKMPRSTVWDFEQRAKAKLYRHNPYLIP